MIGGASCTVTFIDKHSWFGVVAGLHAKSEVLGEYKCREAWLKVQFRKDIWRLQSDCGGEYMGNEFSQHLREHGTVRQLTVHDHRLRTELPKRCNGILVEHVHAMLIDSGLPRFLWLEAMKFAMWIRNRTTTHALYGKTPYEVLYRVKLEIRDIHLWGSRVWAQSLTAGKLDPRGQEGRSAGYDGESKGYRVYWTDSRVVGVEQDLIFEDWSISNETILLPGPPIKRDHTKSTDSKHRVTMEGGPELKHEGSQNVFPKQRDPLLWKAGVSMGDS